MQNESTIQNKNSEYTGSLDIKGHVEIINGETRIKANNRFTQTMLSWLINMTTISYATYTQWNISTSAWNIYIGTNTTTPTSFNTTSLTNPIGGTPGTAASSQVGMTGNPSNGVFNVVFTATWNPGTVSGAIGEMALYLSVRGNLQSFGWQSGAGTETKQLVSRLAVADGSFSPFTINTANPLTINWTVQYSFS